MQVEDFNGIEECMAQMLTQNSKYIAPLKSCYAHLERDSNSVTGKTK